jgi:putative addiction module component (TIGR02574 family)
LAGLLIASLESPPDPDIEAAWAAEIERRVAEVEAGTIKTIPLEEVRQRLLDRFAGEAARGRNPWHLGQGR